MGYTWTDGELITATKLNNTGGGGTSGLVTDTSDELDKTWNELSAIVSAGALPFLVSGGNVYTLGYIDTDGYDYYALFKNYDLDEDSWVIRSYTSSTADGTLVLDE